MLLNYLCFMTKTEIKDARLKDAPVIRELALKIWPAAYGKILSTGQIEYMLNKYYSVEAICDQMTTLNYRFIILFDDAPGGFACYNKEKEGTHKLQKLYVDPEKQGAGYGKTLITEVMKRAVEEGSKELILNVNRFNKARYFYEKLGFNIIDEVDLEIGNGYLMEDYIMRKELTTQ